MHREVAHPLELGDHPQGADDDAEVAGDGLLEREQLEAGVLDLLLGPVDVGVRADHLLGDGGVAGQQRLGGEPDRGLDVAADPGEVVEDPVELFVEGLSHAAIVGSPGTGSPTGREWPVNSRCEAPAQGRCRAGIARTITVWTRRRTALLAALIGGVVVGSAVYAWAISDRLQHRPPARPTRSRSCRRPWRRCSPSCAAARSWSVRTTSCCAPPRRRTPTAWCAGTVLVNAELVELVHQVRRDGEIRESEMLVSRAAMPARHVTARVAPLGAAAGARAGRGPHPRAPGRGGAPRLRRQRQPRAEDAGRRDPAARRGRRRRCRRPRGGAPLQQPDAHRERPALPAGAAGHRALAAPGRRPARGARPRCRSTTWSPRPSTPSPPTPSARDISLVTGGRDRARGGRQRRAAHRRGLQPGRERRHLLRARTPRCWSPPGRSTTPWRSR